MIYLDRMELDDCFTPEDLVNEIYSQCPNLTAPIPIHDIAEAVGVVAITGMPTDDVEGMLVADEGKKDGVIFYRENSPVGRQRFTIGHELGHFLLLHHGANQSCTSKDLRVNSSSNQHALIESEANLFSRKLLMPDELIVKRLINAHLDIGLLKSISDEFQMSFEAVANTCAELSEKPFALIYSKDGVVRYCWRDKTKFKHWLPFKAGDVMPPDSQVIQVSRPDETVSELIKAQVETWFTTNDKSQVPASIFEQTYIQQNGFQVTMLQLADD